MADRYYPVELTVPAGTTPGNPTKQAVALENIILADVEIVVPAGHVALTGVRVLASAQQVIPWGNLSWIKADNYVRVFEYNSEIGANSISVQGFNLDINPHTFYLRFHVRDTANADQGAPSTVVGNTGTILGGGTGGTGVPTAPPVTGPPPIVIPPPPNVTPPTLPGIGGTTTTPTGGQQKYLLLL